MKVIPRINDKLYVRFGEIPKNEKSNIYKGDMGKVGEEIGVSCYNAVVMSDKIYIIMPHTASTTYYWLIDAYNRKQIPLYIVEGEEIGEGSDSEPLLNNVKIIREIFDWYI